jgi:DNA-binding Lrp family transcriptional regulator
MLASGRIRRIGAVPNHYAIGYTANGMSVWDVDDAHIEALGEAIGRLDFVTHCYERPRRLPDWPYNLFAMVHAGDRATVLARVGEIATLLGPPAAATMCCFPPKSSKRPACASAVTANAGKKPQDRA